MSNPATHANRRVLIIDDTPSIHQDFRKILCPKPDSEESLDAAEEELFGTVQVSRQNFELDSAYQGQEALERVKQALAEGRPYALAFIDMRMPPGWDGLETIEHLWKADPQLQIALCTAYSDYSWEAMTERLAFGDQLLILKKPFDSLEIRQMASALTAKWQMAQDAAAKMRNLEQTIAERVQELLKVSHLLQYDVLTELPNSTLLGDRLTQAIALAHRHDTQLAVMFIGLDRFERINNALGHPVGDEVLKLVAQCLVHTVRESDSVFRYGSDEFVLMLSDVHHPQQTKSIAEKLLAAIKVPRYVAGHDLSVTASLGISLFPDDGEEAVTLIKKAETAMRNIKDSGPDNFCFFSNTMNQRAREQHSIESGIRLALERNEFVLHYQPKLNLKTGKIVGAEALIRWLKPGQGWLFPSEFIPVAEDCGLIIPLSKWVLREACRQTCAWQAAGLPPIRMSVNISATEFRQRGFLEGIRTVLEETGMNPELLELEITESVLMQNAESTIQTLQAIKHMGIRLAIDDFGTGYSSLSYLRRFPIDVLKIDQSFVRDLTTDSNDAALVSAIIGLGRSLKLNIIAEGIETQDQLDFLKSNHCEEGQGYFFSRALEPRAFAKILSGGRLEAARQE
jgi:diguanylate cyclase (GGDEF)-like protein